MKTINKITGLLALAGVAMLSISCEKQEEVLIVPIENNMKDIFISGNK